MKNKLRIGNFTSSENFRLINPKPRETYIEEKNLERKLQRSLNSEASGRPTSWGSLVEARCFDLLGLEYKISSQETIQHTKYPYWVGSPDGEKFDEGKTVFDIKCPYTLKSFCELADCKTIQEVRYNHKDGEKYYWQLVSNAVLTNSKYAELIIYCPYQRELEDIRELASNFDGDQNKVAWIGFSVDDDLPYLIEGGHYKNLYIIRFEVPIEDKELLEDEIFNAGKRLIKIKEEKSEVIIKADEEIENKKKIAQKKITAINELKAKLKHVI